MAEASVLIVGGGPAGLTAAGLLTIQGVKCVVLEKHINVSPHPRAVGFTTRTMEIFDMLGIIDQIPQMSGNFRLRRVTVESLAGGWGEEVGAGLGKKPGMPNMLDYSQYSGAAIAQDKLDAILRARVKELGCEVRYGHRMLNFTKPERDEDLINVCVHSPSGEEYTISTRYLLAADGHRSLIRESLGLEMEGEGHISTIQSILFRAPALDKYLERGFHQFQIRQPEPNFQGFLTTYNDSRWVLMSQDDKMRSDEELKKAILSATGIPDLEYEFITTGLWNLSARVAKSFTYPLVGNPRIFLLGDAAHTLPPTRGGYGANTGIADAHNLSWKLAAVLTKQSGADLLNSYTTERRPVAWSRHQQIFAGPDYAPYRKEGRDYGSFKDSVAMELGHIYQSEIIAADVDGSGIAKEGLTLKPDESRGMAGSRAPHVWLIMDEEKVSSLKLFEGEWTLVTTNERWTAAAATASERLGIAIKTICPGLNGVQEASKDDLQQKFDLADNATSLVRPDGVVCWKSKPWTGSDQAAQDLVMAIKQSACTR